MFISLTSVHMTVFVKYTGSKIKVSAELDCSDKNSVKENLCFAPIL